MKSKNFKLIYFAITLMAFFVCTQSCKKKDDPKPSPDLMQVIDVDGNGYRAIKIGDQWWMAENLRVTHYRDGSPINKLENTYEWATDTTGACCVDPLLKYDAKIVEQLYNYYAIQNKKNIAPEGWHIPSDVEWKELERNLGMSPEDADKTSWRGTDQGEQMMRERVEKTVFWTTYGDVWPNNESGFCALPGGCRLFDGTWGDKAIGHTCFWWSSATQGNEVWYRYLDYKNKNVFRHHGVKAYGLSVRCVKD